MGFWTNNPKSERAPKKDKRAKGEKVPAPAQGSTWTHGRQGSAHAVSVLMIAAMACGPIGIGIAVTAMNRPQPASAVTKSDGLTVEQQSTGAYALSFVAAWLGAWKDHPGELGSFIDLTSLRGLSETASEYRDLSVVEITPNTDSDIVTVVISANVKGLIPDPDKEGAGLEAWPRRYFQVPVFVSDSGLRPVGLPVPISGPGLGDTAALAYSKSLPLSEASAQTIQSFLEAYTAGKGELGRYITPEAPIVAIAPAPYQAVEPVDIRTDVEPPKTPKDGVQVHALATVNLTTQLGQTVTTTYALTLTARASRWEVTTIDPAPLEISESTTAPTSSPSR